MTTKQMDALLRQPISKGDGHPDRWANRLHCVKGRTRRADNPHWQRVNKVRVAGNLRTSSDVRRWLAEVTARAPADDGATCHVRLADTAPTDVQVFFAEIGAQE